MCLYLIVFYLPHGTFIIVIPLGGKALAMNVSCVYFLNVFICHYLFRQSGMLPHDYDEFVFYFIKIQKNTTWWPDFNSNFIYI
ncbi:MAG: hypothetical protein B6I20_09565 [Bacteroidetes bacterium 4572_117]|nr:MAG: hypothetical protein B6I20_09565 [Bacteroidetes bacterium 4572_117]